MNRSLSLNSFLLSLALNLSLLLVLSLYKEHNTQQGKDGIPVNFVSLPRTTLKRRAPVILPKSYTLNVQQAQSVPLNVRVTSDISSPRSDSAVPVGIDTGDNFTPDVSAATTFQRQSAISSSASGGDWKRGDGSPSRSGRPGSGGRSGGQVANSIVSRQPNAIISGSGDGLRGYYNISLVKYEDTSDVISADALAQLAGAMNRWTQVRTKVIKEPMMLDDPGLLRVPLVYITSRRAFAFSERERKNLRLYFANGGFLLFSNAADSEDEARGVTNSIEFELWKVLGSASDDLADIGKRHQIYGSFFGLPSSLNLRGIALDDRISVIYEDSGYGMAWRMGEDSKRRPYLKLGVNIIAYALTTSPMAR